MRRVVQATRIRTFSPQHKPTSFSWWLFDFVIHSVLALLQLLGLSGRLKAQRALARIANDPPPADAARGLRIRKVAEVLDRVVGPTAQGLQRVTLALDVLQRLDRKPMRWWQALVISSVLALLLVVPVAGIVVSYSLEDLAGSRAQASMERAAEQSRLDAASWRQAQQMSTDRLVADIEASFGIDDNTPGPVTEADLQAASTRLGIELPSDLVDLYRVRNGSSALALLPMDQITRVGHQLDDWFFDGQDSALDFELVVAPGDVRRAFPVDMGLVADCVLVGTDEGMLLVNPSSAGQPARWLELGEGELLAFASMRDWLEHRWTVVQSSERAMKELEARIDVEQQRLADADWPTILSPLRVELPFPYSWFADEPETPGPASDEELTAAAQRLGIDQLPPDYQALMRLQDGVRELQLSPVAQIQLQDADDLALSPWLSELSRLTNAQPLLGEQGIALKSASELIGCWSLSGGAPPLAGALIQCPEHHRHAGVLDLRLWARYPSVRDYAIRRSAQIAAASGY